MVFFSGEQARKKILKICEAFGANCYPVPEDAIKRRQITRDVWCYRDCFFFALKNIIYVFALYIMFLDKKKGQKNKKTCLLHL